jgi:hypothetical protein
VAGDRAQLLRRARRFHRRTQRGRRVRRPPVRLLPSLARRELGNAYAAILRPAATLWFEANVDDERLARNGAARAFLEGVTGVMRRAMYDPPAQFVRAAKGADRDVAAVGNAVIEARLAPSRTSLLYCCRHLPADAIDTIAAYGGPRPAPRAGSGCAPLVLP